MRRLIAVTAGAAAFAALAAGCSSSSGSGTGSTPAPPAASSTGAAPAGAAASLKTADSADGRIVVDGSGRTLYLFQADTGSTSTCNGACAVAWPPDSTTGTPGGTGLSATVGESARTDKSMQVTYNGHPLYYFSHDAKAGDINGQGVTAFGGTWYLVGPDGTAITTTATPGTSPSTAPSTSGGYGSGY